MPLRPAISYSPCLRLGLLAACLLGLSACQGGGAYFPIGLFNTGNPKDLRSIKKAGFNAVQTYSRDPAQLKALAKAADKAGVKLLAHPQELSASTVPVRGWPMAAWYLVDEPDVNGMSPSELCYLAGKVKAWAPRIPGAFVVGAGAKARDYAACGDILMVDWYPVPHMPLESAGENVRLTVEAAGDKPVWAVLQAMNWKDYAQRDPKKPRVGRFPTYGEIRFMTYHSIIAGAKGVWYFSYAKPGGATLAQSPEEWLAVTAMAKELAALRPIFEGGTPAYLPFPPNPDGPLAKAWRYHGRDYVIIANPKPKAMQLVPEALLAMHWRPLFETRRYQKELLKKVGEGFYRPPYRVLVFESRLSWRSSRPKTWP